MKTKLFLFAFLLISISQKINSQPYAPFLNNSSWSITVYNFGGAQSYIISPGTDVVIGSYTYRKITDTTNGTDAYIREDVAAKKVYKLNNNVDELLYDFSLPVGGTFTAPFGSPFSTYTVNSISTVTMLNGVTRRMFSLSNTFGNLLWVEGVGATEHPLRPKYELPSDPAYFLDCSAQNNVLVYNRGLAIGGGVPTDCSLLGVDENQLAESITFSPNPFSSALQINLGVKLNNASLKLFNSLGQAIREVSGINGNNYSLIRDNLDSGLYYIQISQESRIIASKKIIVQD